MSSDTPADAAPPAGQATLLGHPTGLFMLFFAEMWERFSFYGMRALLVLYMIKGFLEYPDDRAYLIYGAYGSLVYATPFIGGMIADRLLGARKAVILGAVFMAAGHLVMGVEDETAFFYALALLIVGNGFFKPNISTIVGSLYPADSTMRDSGFTLFYMGINLGAAIAPLLCGYIGETYGWHYGFGLATGGMLVGLAIFVLPNLLTQALIALSALATAGAMLVFTESNILLAVNSFVALMLLISAGIAVLALSRGGLPAEAGTARDPEFLSGKIGGVLSREWAVYIGTFLSVPLFAILVQRSDIAGWLLIVGGGVALAYLLFEAVRADKIERERLFVVLILMFFSMLFWSFFEQAGSSVNNFTDRNVDRVLEERVVQSGEVGDVITAMEMNQEQLGYTNGDQVVTMTVLNDARKAGEGGKASIDWPVSDDDVGMGVEGEEIPASTFQAANPIYILIFGLVFSWLWGYLGARGLEPSVPVKFALGLLQLGLGFAALWYGASMADERGMVSMSWLLVGYLLHTTGELCLSPVGLSMVTKLSPARIVSTTMGAWFLATAFSHYLAALIAQLTGVAHSGDGAQVIPIPAETVGIYGSVFGQIAVAAIASSVVLFVMSPLLKKWMHGVN